MCKGNIESSGGKWENVLVVLLAYGVLIQTIIYVPFFFKRNNICT